MAHWLSLSAASWASPVAASSCFSGVAPARGLRCSRDIFIAERVVNDSSLSSRGKLTSASLSCVKGGSVGAARTLGGVCGGVTNSTGELGAFFLGDASFCEDLDLEARGDALRGEEGVFWGDVVFDIATLDGDAILAGGATVFWGDAAACFVIM